MRQLASTSFAFVTALVLAAFTGQPAAWAQDADQAFREECIAQAKGSLGTASLEPATEDKIQAYCDCSATSVQQQLTPEEASDIGTGKASDETMAKLHAAVAECHQQHMQ